MAGASPDFARPDRAINHVIAYGQSLSNGWDGWPVLSSTPRHDSLMLGDSVRSADPWSAEWRPVGGAGFRPLVATRQVISGPNDPVTALGETVLETAVNLWRGRMLARPGAASASRRLLASSCGVGGQSLELLSKGGDHGYFERIGSCARAARAAAAGVGLDYGVVALLFLQGESNSWGGPGTTSDRAAYKRMLRRFRQESGGVVAEISDRARPPAMFLYQTAGSYANETVSIAQAQLELALEDPSCIMVAPAYALTGTPTGHLDANGYRWLGAHFGRVMHRVLDLGESWRPLHPVHVSTDGVELVVAFHVLVAPLRWGHPIPGQTQIEIPDRGFTVIDADGPVAIASVEIVSATAVRILLARPPGAAAELRYASKRTHGVGCLQDSDPDLADCPYSFDPSVSEGFQFELPDLVGRPYPLVNWCVGFALPVARGVGFTVS